MSWLGKVVKIGIITCLLFGLNASFLEKIEPAKAGTISNISLAAADSTKSAATTYTMSFQLENALSYWYGRIYIYFNGPSAYGTNFSYSNNAINFTNASLSASSSPSSLYLAGSGYNYLSLATSSTIAAGSTINLTISNVTNPSMGGYYYAHIYTTRYGSELDGTSAFSGNFNSGYIEIGNNTNFKGTVTDSDGNPVTYAYVYLSKNGSNYFYANTYTDKDGKFGFGDIPASTYDFSISYFNSNNNGITYFPPDTARVNIPESGSITQDANFISATKTLTGRITKDTSDGTPVTDATVYATKMSGNGQTSVRTDSNGNYSLSLTGGNWYLSLSPVNYPADWLYSSPSETITFTSDTSVEAKTKNFTVESINSTIVGIVTKPDGSTITQWSAGISFSNTKNQYFSGTFDANGNFTARVTKGTYTVYGWTGDSNYAFPKIDNFSISENETKSLGQIKLIEKTDSISGKVTDDAGNPVSGAYISAWRNDGTSDWANATSASDGTYTMKVTPGSWQISAWPQWNSGYVYNGTPSPISVTTGTPATKDFVFRRASATILGTITGPDGAVLSNLSSWVNASDGSQNWGTVGAMVQNGQFTLKVPPGTWDVSAYLYGVDYSSPEPQQVTVGENETKSITLQALRNDATISGTIYDEEGNKITGKWLGIYATKGRYGSWQSADLNQDNGTYSIKVSAGTWNLGWWIDPNLGYNAGSGQDTEIVITSGETKTHDIILKKVDSTISGKALRADGTPMPWAWITADTRDPNEKTRADIYYYNNGTSSNNNGDFTLRVPAGTYWVGGSMWSGSGYINPKRQKVTVDASTPASVDLTFRTADSTISGNVRNGGATAAYVTAWSEDGGYSEANANNEGSYSLAVSSGTKWHIKARKELNKEVYVSEEYIVDMTSSNTATLNIQLEKQTFSLPDAKTVTFDPTIQQTITLDDNTIITIPANTLANSGQITLSVEPKIELAEEADAKPLDYGYEITATTQSGQEITSFNGYVTIEDTYTDQIINETNLTNEDELVAAYYNESAGTWDELPNNTVNASENSVTYQTNHFTKFALVSASDTTPPSAPTYGVSTAGNSTTTLRWTNPTDTDLTGIKIYRSTQSGTLGDLITTIENKATTSYENTSLTNGTTYYYTIRSYDASGNASINTNQISLTPSQSATTSSTATTLPTTGSKDHTGLNVFALIFAGLLTLTGFRIYRKRTQLV